MNLFGEVLISTGKNPKISDELNLFGQFVGEWDFDWYDRAGAHEGRHVRVSGYLAGF